MRRAIRDALPALAYHFGLRPADIDDMTDAEVEVFLDALKTIADGENDG